MNDSLNNKELVAVGHQFAKAMSSDTPIIDMAKMFTRLAERLDCTTAALREMTKERDAEHGDVLTWEKTMFKACGEDGPKSVADKFAELEAKCAALAAENAGLKHALEWLYETVSSESVSIPDEKYSSVTNAAQVLSETTSTDAFLAELRASAVDSLIDIKINQLARMHPDTHAFGATADFIRSQINELQSFAALLRKGVQS